MSIITPNATWVNPSIATNPDRHGLRAPRGGCTVAGKLYRGGQFCRPFDPANPHGVEATPSVTLPASVSIHGFVYEVKPVPVAPEIGSVAFDLHKLDTGNNYVVMRSAHGLVLCDCGDYLFRHAGTGAMCKHGSRLVELGMVPAPTPIPTTVGRREFFGHVSAYRNTTPTRSITPHRRRFEPSPEEMAEAAQLFGDVEAARIEFRREFAAAL